MEYKNIQKGYFISRPNRFIAKVKINDQVHTVHVKNTGRCKELLTDNASVLLEKSDNPNRKTQFDLVAVYKGDTLINMDSYAPNLAAGEWLRNGGIINNPTIVKSEVVFGSSRLDFYIEGENEKAFVEVKGVTLEENAAAKFPDAPTKRGAKHLAELENAVRAGYDAYALFVVQMQGCKYFTPNSKTDKEFSQALKRARDNNVKIIAVECEVKENSMIITKEIEVKL